MTPSPDAERAPVDLDEAERDASAMPGVFKFIASVQLRNQHDEPSQTWSGDQLVYEERDARGLMVGMSIAEDIDPDDGAAMARILNRHAAMVAELSAARERIAALVAALDEAADIAARGERACLDHIDRWRALAHPTEGDPAP